MREADPNAILIGNDEGILKTEATELGLAVNSGAKVFKAHDQVFIEAILLFDIDGARYARPFTLLGVEQTIGGSKLDHEGNWLIVSLR